MKECNYCRMNTTLLALMAAGFDYTIEEKTDGSAIVWKHKTEKDRLLVEAGEMSPVTRQKYFEAFFFAQLTKCECNAKSAKVAPRIMAQNIVYSRFCSVVVLDGCRQNSQRCG